HIVPSGGGSTLGASRNGTWRSMTSMACSTKEGNSAMSDPTRHNGIIVGADGAAREASLRELPLTIIYVSPSPMVAGDIPMPVNLTERLEKHGQSVLREARSTAGDAVEGSHPIPIDTE